MSKELTKRLLAISSILLMLAGIIFLFINIFSEAEGNMYLIAALVCILLANLFNVINNLNNKEKK